MARYDIVSHTADVGIVAHGASIEEVFGNAAFAMFDLMYDLGSASPIRSMHVRVAGSDIAELLVDWLSELLSTSEIDDVIPCTFRIDLTATGISAEVGVADAAGRELVSPPIKAVTYHDLHVGMDAGGRWSARVIFDV